MKFCFEIVPVEHRVAKIITRFVYKIIFYKIISRVEYSFINLLLLMDALVKVVAARNPFFLFGSGYISIGNVTFEIDDEENVHGL